MVLGLIYGFVYALGIQCVFHNYYCFLYIFDCARKFVCISFHFVAWIKHLHLLESTMFILYFIWKDLLVFIKGNELCIAKKREKWSMH